MILSPITTADTTQNQLLTNLSTSEEKTLPENLVQQKESAINQYISELDAKLSQIPIFKQFSSSDSNQEKNINAKITFVSQDSYKNGPASIGNNGAIYVKNDVIVMGQFYGLSVSKDN